MSFYKGTRNRVQLVIPEDEEVLTEQHHKKEVDINEIVRRNAGNMELITKVQALQNFQFDDVTNNDFQEMMNQMLVAKEAFTSVPSEIRKRFGNDPAAFMDFVHDKENKQQLIDWGLANPPAPEPAPQKVEVVNPPENPPTP